MILLIILEIAMIIGYLFETKFGFLISLFLFIYYMFFKRKKCSFLERIIQFAILAMPTYNVGFIGNSVHHFLSWTNMSMYVYLLYLLDFYFSNKKIGKKRINKNILLLIITTTCILLGSSFFRANFMNSIFNIIQFLLMFVTILLSFDLKDVLIQKLNNNSFSNWKNAFNISLFATALCTIFQYLYYKNTGNIIGEMTFFIDNRIDCDLLFKAYSILSFYMGLGIAINFKDFLNNGKLYNILLVVICFIGIVINSARTGIVSALFTCLLILFGERKKVKRPILTFFIICLAFYFGAISINYMLMSRGTSSLLDSNNRGITYIYGFNILFSSLFNILFGAGLSLDNYTYALPHNFILETLTTTGFIVTFIIIMCLIYLLFYLKKTEFKYIVYYLLIGSMFVTNFQGNTFATIIFSIAIFNELYNRKGIKQ